MKKTYTGIPFLLFLILILSGCSAVGSKTASLTLVYAAMAVLALVMIAVYFTSVRKKNAWYILLFCSIAVVNTGYFLLSVSNSLTFALVSNAISYLGSVFLPLSMLMILLDVTDIKYNKLQWCILLALSGVMFLITATPGILDIYYKEVSFEVVNGVSTLVKVYGPLHPLYLVYLLGYFGTMIVLVVRGFVNRTLYNISNSVILTIAVFVNIGVWFIEQLVDIPFEMLSVSYIISELFLLGIHFILNENQRLRDIIEQAERMKAQETEPVAAYSFSKERIEAFLKGVETLTKTETVIYEAHLARIPTKEIMSKLCITENTLKFHNKNIYSKLCVCSKKELLELYRQSKKEL